MSKFLGLAVAAGLLSAVLFLAMGQLLPPLVYLAPLPLFAAGLGLGLALCGVAAAVGVAAVVLALGAGGAVPYAVTAALPAVVVVRQALLWRTTAEGKVEWYPPGLLVGWLAGLGLAGMAVAALVVPSHPDGLEGLVRDQVSAFIGSALVQAPPEIREALISLWVPFLPAMVAAAWMLAAVANAAGAQGLLRRAGRNLRPSPAYVGLELPDWLAVAFALTVAAAVFADGDVAYGARNMAAFLLVPFLFLGLAGVHGALRQRPNGGMLLGLFYGLFFLVFGWAVIIVAALGLIRHWTKLRRRLAGGRQEEE